MSIIPEVIVQYYKDLCVFTPIDSYFKDLIKHLSSIFISRTKLNIYEGF